MEAKLYLRKRIRSKISVQNLFREFSLKNIEGYQTLTESEKNLFDRTYRKHLMSLDEKDRKFFAENQLKKFENDLTLIKVSFKNGDSYLYLQGHDWIKI